MGRNGESKLPRFQKYKEHEKRGLGALIIELGKLENPSYGEPQIFDWMKEKMVDFGLIFPILIHYFNSLK